MKIAFFTEMNMTGKIDRSIENMRTEFAWMSALQADHLPLRSVDSFTPGTSEDKFDISIIIFPKSIPKDLLKVDVVEKIRYRSTKVGFMQEGPSWYFQSLDIEPMFWFMDQMMKCDFVLAHNQIDKVYYEGLLQKPTLLNPTLMIEDRIKEIDTSIERKGIIIGGNIGEWYGGFNSLAVAMSVDQEIWFPRMGRMKSDELYIEGLNHLPYLSWLDWMKALNNFKYAIHLNPNTIGGTFSLNCAYLGIPCIGNRDADTQRLCFPDLSIDVRDLSRARTLIKHLTNDPKFYRECSLRAQENFVSWYREEKFLETWNSIHSSIMSIEKK